MEMALNPAYPGLQRAARPALRLAPRPEAAPPVPAQRVRLEPRRKAAQRRAPIGLWRTGFMIAAFIYYAVAAILWVPMACANRVGAVSERAG